jgi:molecular chaperone DnaK
MSGKVLGIDLGTTNSVVAIANGRESRVLADAEGRRLIPSVVSFHPDGSILVGHEARERRLVDAKNTVYSTKRLIGRPFNSPEVQRAKERFAFDLEPTKVGGVQVRVRRGAFALPEISAMVLRHLRRVAEDALGEPCGRAVVTVPANFNELQRSATQAAGKVAGLEVLRILNEPTAATLAYGLSRERAEKVAVYDLGGGTFDITVLDLDKDVFEVVSTAGDTFLGGDDLDLLVAEKMADACLAQHRFDARVDPQAFERMRAAAEWAKCQLSSVREVDVTLEELFNDSTGASKDFSFHMSRAELEQLIRPIVARTFDVVNDALRSAGRRPKEIDSVVLVGGSTRIPMVRSMVEDFFGRAARMDIDPDLVVAQGAAIHGFTIAGEKATPEKGKAVARVALKKQTRPIMAVTEERVRKQPAFAPEHQDDRAARVVDQDVPAAPAAAPAPPRQPTQPLPGRTAPKRPLPDDDWADVPTQVGARPDLQTLLRREAETRAAEATKAPSAEPPKGVLGEAPASAPVAVIRSVGVSGPMPATPPAATATPDDDLDVQPTQVGPAPKPRRQPTLMGSLPGASPFFANDPPTPVPTAPAARPQTLPGGPQPQEPAREPSARRRAVDAPPPSPAAREAPKAALGRVELVRGASASAPPAPVSPAPVATGPAVSVSGLELSSSAFQVPDDPDLAETLREAEAALSRPARQQAELPLPGAAPIEIASSPAPTPTWGGLDAPRAPARAPQPTRTPAQPQARPGPVPTAPIPVASPPAPPAPPAPAPLTFAPRAPAPPAPAAPAPERPAPRQPVVAMPDRVAPLLMDVTPLSLGVETAGGFCQAIVHRNAPIPTEKSRVFATARDGQAEVELKICQGESNRFGENQALGTLLITPLRRAKRGDVRIEITFMIDQNGILDVKAKDLDARTEQAIRIALRGGVDQGEIDEMRRRQEGLLQGR